MPGSNADRELAQVRSDVAKALEGSGVGQREITAFHICGTDDVGVQLLGDETGATRESQRAEWEKIRDAMQPLGRAPIGNELFFVDLVETGGEGTPYDRANWSFNEPDDPRVLPRALIDASFEIHADETNEEGYERRYPNDPSPAGISPDWHENQLRNWREFEVPTALRYTQQRLGDAPTVEQIVDALGEPRRGTVAGYGDSALDRLLFEWEEARAPTTEPEWDHDFHPWDDTWDTIDLLPLPWSWTSPAYLSFEGAPDREQASHLLAVLRSWHDRYGTEVVSTSGTLLELTSSRPPQTLDDAYRMATQLHGAHREKGPTRATARALWRRRDFTLYQRP